MMNDKKPKKVFYKINYPQLVEMYQKYYGYTINQAEVAALLYCANHMPDEIKAWKLGIPKNFLERNAKRIGKNED